MVTRLLSEQVRCRVRGDDDSLVGAIIRGAEDCARTRQQQQEGAQDVHVTSPLQTHISSLISAAMVSLPIDKVLALLTGMSDLARGGPLRER
jgi:hypothetical protein